MKNKMNIYISTSDNYLHLLKPFSYLFNKFWSDSQRVFILGYKSPSFELPDNFKFISMGEQKGIQYWANDLHKFFSSIDDEHFIFLKENYGNPKINDEQKTEIAFALGKASEDIKNFDKALGKLALKEWVHLGVASH